MHRINARVLFREQRYTFLIVCNLYTLHLRNGTLQISLYEIFYGRKYACSISVQIALKNILQHHISNFSEKNLLSKNAGNKINTK